MKPVFLVAAAVLLLAACKSKNPPDENTNFFPVLSFLKSQVAQIDSSVYPLMKIETVDSTSDTTYIKREEFDTYARNFIALPDISSPALKNKYTETKLYEESINSVALDYTPKSAEGEIRREEVLIAPDAATGDKVKSIIIDITTNKGDSTIHKKMFWQVNKRFQIVTITQKNDQPEKIKTVHIIWNDFPSGK